MINNHSSLRNIKSQTGSSLLEILVTIIILAIGLLGLAGLQNLCLKFAYDSHLRTQASFLTYDLVDRIRANPDGGVYNLAFNQSPIATDCFVGDTPCNETDIRNFDLFYWRQQAEEILPEAITDVSFNPAQNLYTLRLEWNDRNEDDVQGTETKEFVYSFQIN